MQQKMLAEIKLEEQTAHCLFNTATRREVLQERFVTPAIFIELPQEAPGFHYDSIATVSAVIVVAVVRPNLMHMQFSNTRHIDLESFCGQ